MQRKSRLLLPTGHLIRDLRRRWPQLDLVQRGQEVQKLVDAGFSRRALARVLKCSEGVVRRYLKLARLREATRRAIGLGASTKRVLEAQRRGLPLPEASAEELRCHQEKELVGQCLAQLRPWLERLLPEVLYRDQFLDEADRRLWQLRRWRPREPLLPSAPRFELGRWRPRRPRPHYAPDLFEYMLEWLVPWVLRILPTPELREKLLQGFPTQS